MIKYETLVLAGTSITADELLAMERFFEKFTSDAKGKLNSFDKWGKYKLAYPVKKNEYGVYVLVRYELSEEFATQAFKELDSFLRIKFNEIVLRYVTIKLPKNASPIYKKPESLDMSRSGDLDTFLKENKMDSLLEGVDAASISSAPDSNGKAGVDESWNDKDVDA